MQRLIFLLLLVGYTTFFARVFANDEDDLGLSLGKEESGMAVDKAQISQMVDLMQAQGQISAEDAAKAKQELNQKSDAEMQTLQKTAMDRINSGNIPTLPAPTTVATAAPTTVAAPAAAPVPAEAVKTADDRSKKLNEAFKFINE